MTKEKHIHTDFDKYTELCSVFFKLTGPLVAGTALALLASGSFSEKVRFEIKKRDNWKCQKCQCDWRPYLHASHDHHSRNHPLYKKAEGGRTLCIACHYDYHFENHHDCLRLLGLTPSQNIYALTELWKSMEMSDRRKRQNRDYRLLATTLLTAPQ